MDVSLNRPWCLSWARWPIECRHHWPPGREKGARTSPKWERIKVSQYRSNNWSKWTSICQSNSPLIHCQSLSFDIRGLSASPLWIRFCHECPWSRVIFQHVPGKTSAEKWWSNVTRTARFTPNVESKPCQSYGRFHIGASWFMETSIFPRWPQQSRGLCFLLQQLAGGALAKIRRNQKGVLLDK